MKIKLLFAILLCLCFSTLKAQSLQGDPWIFKVYKEVYDRNPNALELNINNYNAGAWNNYDELKKYVKDFQASLSQGGVTISTVIVKKIAIVGVYQDKVQVAVSALSLTGGQILANDGASIISGGAGNIISGGAGNFISNDGGSIQVNKNMGGLAFGGSYTIQSATTRVIKSGKGALIIKAKK